MLALKEVAVLRRRDELLRRRRECRCSTPRRARSARPSRCDGSRRSTARRGRSRPRAAGRTSRVSCGSFSATMTIVRRAARLARTRVADRRQDVRRRRVEDLLRRVEAQAVEVKLVDPVAGVGDEELAHRPGVGAVEVDRVAPLVLVAVGEVRRRERAQVVADRAEMVVDDVEDDADAERVRAVDERAGSRRACRRGATARTDRRRRSPSRSGRRTRRPASPRSTVMPSVASSASCAAAAAPGALARERADVQLVDDLAGERHAAPRAVGPRESARIDDLRRAVRTVRLEPRRRIRIEPLAIRRRETDSGRRPGPRFHPRNSRSASRARATARPCSDDLEIRGPPEPRHGRESGGRRRPRRRPEDGARTYGRPSRAPHQS